MREAMRAGIVADSKRDWDGCSCDGGWNGALQKQSQVRKKCRIASIGDFWKNEATLEITHPRPSSGRVATGSRPRKK